MYKITYILVLCLASKLAMKRIWIWLVNFYKSKIVIKISTYISHYINKIVSQKNKFYKN